MGESRHEITMPVAEAVADVLDRPVEELPPLSEAVDLEGLNAIVSGDPSHDVTVTFSYAGLRVLVHSGNTIYVCPLQETEPQRVRSQNP